MDLETAQATLWSSAPMADRAKALRGVLADKLGVNAPVADLARDWLFGDLADKVRVFGLWTLAAPLADLETAADAIRWHMTRLGETSAVSRSLATYVDFSTIIYS